MLRNTAAYPAAVPEAWNTEIQIYRGFWMVSWFKEQFGLRMQAATQQLQDTGKLKTVRRGIARVRTLMGQKLTNQKVQA